MNRAWKGKEGREREGKGVQSNGVIGLSEHRGASRSVRPVE